jgi:prepilin-type N-terminal cleavage/methylation domain-containing protein
MKHRRSTNSQNGFTLVEIIITVVAAGILGAIFINLMGTVLSESWRSVEMVRDEADGVRIMEQIISDYVAVINGNDPTPWVTLVDLNDYGPSVTMEYITFDTSGNAVATTKAASTALMVTVQATGKNLTNILTKSRPSANDALIRY